MERFVTWTPTLSLALSFIACGGDKEVEAKNETIAANGTSGEAEKPSTIQPFQAVGK